MMKNLAELRKFVGCERGPHANRRCRPRARHLHARLMRSSADDLAVQLRHASMELDAFDDDGSRSLCYREFSRLVREREMGIHSEIALRRRFAALEDPPGCGSVDAAAYIAHAIREALVRSGVSAGEVLSAWDHDGSGDISQEEFRVAMQANGFRVSESDVARLFAHFDHSGDGTISQVELFRTINGQQPEVDRRALRRLAVPGRQWYESDEAALQGLLQGPTDQSAHVLNAADTPPGGTRGAAHRGSPAATGSLSDGMAQQTLRARLASALAESNTRLLDLFRRWDASGDGLVDRHEFSDALRSLGVDERSASTAELGAFFDRFDRDRSGAIDYHELRRALVRSHSPRPKAPCASATAPKSHRLTAVAVAGGGGSGGGDGSGDGDRIGGTLATTPTSGHSPSRAHSALRREQLDASAPQYAHWLRGGLSQRDGQLADPLWQPGRPRAVQRTLSRACSGPCSAGASTGALPYASVSVPTSPSKRLLPTPTRARACATPPPPASVHASTRCSTASPYGVYGAAAVMPHARSGARPMTATTTPPRAGESQCDGAGHESCAAARPRTTPHKARPHRSLVPAARLPPHSRSAPSLLLAPRTACGVTCGRGGEGSHGVVTSPSRETRPSHYTRSLVRVVGREALQCALENLWLPDASAPCLTASTTRPGGIPPATPGAASPGRGAVQLEAQARAQATSTEGSKLNLHSIQGAPRARGAWSRPATPDLHDLVAHPLLQPLRAPHAGARVDPALDPAPAMVAECDESRGSAGRADLTVAPPVAMAPPLGLVPSPSRSSYAVPPRLSAIQSDDTPVSLAKFVPAGGATGLVRPMALRGGQIATSTSAGAMTAPRITYPSTGLSMVGCTGAPTTKTLATPRDAKVPRESSNVPSAPTSTASHTSTCTAPSIATSTSTTSTTPTASRSLEPSASASPLTLPTAPTAAVGMCHGGRRCRNSTSSGGSNCGKCIPELIVSRSPTMPLRGRAPHLATGTGATAAARAPSLQLGERAMGRKADQDSDLEWFASWTSGAGARSE